MASGEMSRNWLELPPQLTESILVRLGPVYMLTARKVCKSWRSICSDPRMWRVLDMRNSCNVDFDVYMVRKAVDLSSGQLIEFSIDNFADNDMLLYIANRYDSYTFFSYTSFLISRLIALEGNIGVLLKWYELTELHKDQSSNKI